MNPTPSLAAQRRAILLMLLSAASFTANVLLIRALGTMGTTNLWLVTSSRFVMGLIMVSTLYRREFQPSHLYRNLRLVERGVVGAVGVYLTYLTVVKLGAGRAIFIGNTYVIWGALMAAWLLREKLRTSVLIGSVAGLVGLGLLTNVFASATQPGIYDLLAIVTALVSAYVVVIIRQLHHNEHTSTIFAAQCAYGLLLCLIPAMVTYQPLSGSSWIIIILASFTAGSGQLTMTRAFRDLPVAEGSLIQMLVPVGVAAGGMFFFKEHFSLAEVLGAALVLGGTAFTALRR